jgi:pimeloyl-ACP methyl ester carboxylesterase
MPEQLSVFRSAEGEAEYRRVYEAMLSHWPVACEEFDLSTRSGVTHVLASGSPEAPPVVLLHPTGGSALTWIRNVEALSERFWTCAIDTVGEPNKSHLSRRINSRNQSDVYAEWMIDVLDGLGIQRTHLVANSFGGFVAMNSILCLPKRIGKAVLISPADTFTPMWGWYWRFPAANMIDPLLGTTLLRLAALRWIWQDLPAGEDMGRLRQMTAIHGRPRHWFPRVFTDEELRKVRTPILLLIGDCEVIYKPQKAIQRAKRLIPSLRAEIIPHANHIAEYTAHEAVNREILDFFGEGETM